MTKCLKEYRKTPHYNAIADKITNTYKEADFSKLVKVSEFMHPNGKFINHICDETYAKFIEDDEDLSSDEDIDDEIYDDITDEEPDNIIESTQYIEPCYKDQFQHSHERPWVSQLPERSSEYDKFYD
jgi:hypothetical protein